METFEACPSHVPQVASVLEVDTRREFVILKQENSGELVLSLKQQEV